MKRAMFHIFAQRNELHRFGSSLGTEASFFTSRILYKLFSSIDKLRTQVIWDSARKWNYLEGSPQAIQLQVCWLTYNYVHPLLLQGH